MPAAKKNLKIEQGATFIYSFTWDTNGVPVNLQGYSARMQLRSPIDSPDVIHELTTENGGITLHLNPAGKISLFISDSDTAAFDFDTCDYDLEVVAPNGYVYKLMKGEVTLDKEVTR